MLDQVFAKYNKDKYSGEIKSETLVEHTENVLQALSKLKNRTLGLDESFWKATFITCLFHDSGKIAKNFQNSLGRGVRDERMRHELLSGIILWFFSKEFFFTCDKHLASVYSHHKRLNSELIDKDDSSAVFLEIDDLKEWFDFTYQKLNENDNQYQKPPEGLIAKFSSVTPDIYRNLFLHTFFDEYKLKWREKDRLKYIYAKAALNISDWSASGHFELSEPLTYTESNLLYSLEQKLIKEGKDFKNLSFRKFQLESKKESSVLAIAPTGSGKTEASLIWASQKNEFDKIIYCLPTRVTSNAIYKRLTEYFGNENCSVVHSSALLYQKEVDKDYDSRNYLRDKTFFSNVTVCTIDQLLTQGFNLGFWEVKSFHCRNASIVIDEIHLYSPYTLALILNTIKFLRENFNARFFIMSATMPNKLRKLLDDALKNNNNYSLIQDTELLQSSRNTFEVRNINVQDNIQEIREALKAYQKVLVVVNTVDQAIGLFQRLRPMVEESNKSCICFHSRFIQKDRQTIENSILELEKIGKPILLIATQVVEVSLDIDFDILFTENAPIDAIIQRAGRVNRTRNPEKDSKVIIHQHSEISEKYIYTEKDILEKTFEIFADHHNSKITEGDFLSLVDKVYEDIDVTQKISFKDGWEAYSKIQSHYHYLGDCDPNSEEVMTRDGLDTVNVIPSQFYEKLQDVNKYDKVKYELSIQKKRFLGAKRYTDSDNFRYIEYSYDDKIGLIFDNKNDNNIACIL